MKLGGIEVILLPSYKILYLMSLPFGLPPKNSLKRTKNDSKISHFEPF